MNTLKNYLLNLGLIIFFLRDIIFTKMKINFKPFHRINPSTLSKWIVSTCVTHIYGDTQLHLSKNEVIILCLVKNSENTIQQFIKYYFNLGARQIVFLDNGSTDNTISLARKHRNVTILSNLLPYKTYTDAFKQYLIANYGIQQWCLCVDIDEYFDYPYSNRISLSSLINYLNKNSYNTVVTQMLDMFFDKPLPHIKKTNNFINTFKYFDISNITKTELRGKNVISNRNIKFHYDGIRYSVFNIKDILLTKYSLIKLNSKLTSDDFRNHYFERNAKLADFSCVLYHYKFTESFYEKCLEAIKDTCYWNDSIQYKKYFNTLNNNPNLNIKKMANNPIELKNVDDLIKLDFLQVSKNYIQMIENNL